MGDEAREDIERKPAARSLDCGPFDTEFYNRIIDAAFEALGIVQHDGNFLSNTRKAYDKWFAETVDALVI